MHIFRRTWAANAVRQGIHRPYIQAVAGWSTPTMLDHYTAAMLGKEEAVEAFRNSDPPRGGTGPGVIISTGHTCGNGEEGTFHWALDT